MVLETPQGTSAAPGPSAIRPDSTAITPACYAATPERKPTRRALHLPRRDPPPVRRKQRQPRRTDRRSHRMYLQARRRNWHSRLPSLNHRETGGKRSKVKNRHARCFTNCAASTRSSARPIYHHAGVSCICCQTIDIRAAHIRASAGKKCTHAGHPDCHTGRPTIARDHPDRKSVV